MGLVSTAGVCASISSGSVQMCQMCAHTHTHTIIMAHTSNEGMCQSSSSLWWVRCQMSNNSSLSVCVCGVREVEVTEGNETQV